MRINVNGTIVPSNDKWIYDYLGIESISPKDINDTLEKASGELVDVYVNSGGGHLFSGIEMYSALRDYSGKMKIHVMSRAGSAASVMAMAGESEISPPAMVMIHNVSGGAEGDYNVMDHTSEVLQNANKAIAAAYMAKTGMSEKEVLAMMNKETWFTAKKAVEMKLIDKVMFDDTGQLAASYNSGLLPRSVIDHIRNTVKNPFSSEKNEADFLLAQTRLNLLKNWRVL